MNKLIIIGNGFDLAHGLETSYKDFLNHYFESIKNHNGTLTMGFHYEDQLLEVSIPSITYERTPSPIPKYFYFDWFMNSLQKKRIKSPFFERILHKAECNWVDIENEFFNYLQAVQNLDYIKRANSDLEYIKEKLACYLLSEEERFSDIILSRFIELFGFGTEGSSSLCFLNFNYTNTAKKYYEHCKNLWSSSKRHLSLINIHGTINMNDGLEPIFGIGDEHHDEYRKWKEDPDLSIKLKNSKSFWYLRNLQYTQLRNFMNAQNRSRKANLRIEIYGHSCGLSDRTLLKYLFQHENTFEINLIHYNALDGYVKQTYDVWRHFDESIMFRDRLLPFDPDAAMPQAEQ